MTVRHLGSISIDTIERIHAVRFRGKPSDCTSRDDIQAFVTRHGNVLVSWSTEGVYYQNAERLTLFSCITVRLKKGFEPK